MTQRMLHTRHQLGPLQLTSRVVMAPMTRCRAIGNVPNALMARFYADRASAGLLVTEGTAPSANGLGYARIPGCYTPAQAEGWKLVTDAVHQAGGRIFVQLMHTGRCSHPLNMSPGTRILAPSAVQLSGKMWTDQQQEQPYPVPEVMDLADIEQAQNEFVQGAKLAIAAGFDGVELHAANGYLIDQFTNPASNQRQDEYGGSGERRARFAVEVAKRTAAAIGAERVGIRLSPHGVFNDMTSYPGLDDDFVELATRLSDLKLTYLHLVDHNAMGAPEVPLVLKRRLRQAFKQSLIQCGGFDADKAEQVLSEGLADLVAFGRPFIANSKLVDKLATGAALTQPDHTTFYTPGEKGYTDYPA
jgi:N-ethylmaleimide reductase